MTMSRRVRGWGNMTAAERKVEAKRRREVGKKNKQKYHVQIAEQKYKESLQLEDELPTPTDDEVDRDFISDLFQQLRNKYLKPLGWIGGNKIHATALALFTILHED
jgi:hypothetical protein